MIYTRYMSLTNDDIDLIKQLLMALENRIDDRFDNMETGINKRFDDIDKRFEQVDERFEQIDERFEQVDEKFDEVLNAIGTEFNDQEVLIQKSSSTIDDHENRITKLESAAA